ncbi:MAG: hypothetical protein HMLKMBBP_00656 [Planctomycetes bacterium]|nr:hypothetical protein [Planctomycetota bacterium]
MFQYVLKRLLAMVPTLLGITFITFLIINLAPGDPVSETMGGGGEAEGAESQARKADAVKAKKKLLGILEPEHAVRSWTVDGTVPRTSDGKPTRPREMERQPDVGEFEAWSVAADLSKDGKTLWCGTEDGRLHAVDLAGGGTGPAIRLGEKGVASVAASPDGSRVAAGDQGGGIYVVAATGASGAAQAVGKPFGLPVRGLAFSPDGTRLVSACNDGKVRVHDAADGKVLQTLGDHTSYAADAAFAPDGSRFWTAGYDRKIREWTFKGGEAVAKPRVIATAGGPVNVLAASGDGRRLAAGSDDRAAYVFDVTAAGADAKPLSVRKSAHAKSVTAVALSADGKLLATAAGDGVVKLWSVDDDAQAAQSRDNSAGEFGAVLFADGGARLLTASRADRKTALWKRYATWLGRTARLDFDRSFLDEERVMDKVWKRLPVTLGLNLLSILITYLIAIPIGIRSAVKRGQTFDRATSLVMFMLWSVPSFWAATMLIQWFSSERAFNWFPSVGLHSPGEENLAYLPWLADFGKHLVLPMIVFTYGSFAGLSQYMRTSLLENIAQDYVRTARAKGLPERAVIYKHALRNSLITLVTFVATLLPGMIGGSVIVEQIFSIDGMGRLGFEAILKRDYPVIMAITTMSAFLTLLGMLVSDVLYPLVDPRITRQ